MTTKLDAVVPLDSFGVPGAPDDDRLDAAVSYAAAQTHVPTISFGQVSRTFTRKRPDYGGLKFLGPSGRGWHVTEQNGGKYVGATVTIAIPGGGPWFTGTATSWGIDVREFAFIYGAGSRFWSQPTGTEDACCFADLSHEGPAGVFGTASEKFLTTLVVFEGRHDIVGCTDTPIHLGGSDCLSLFAGGQLNIENPAGGTMSGPLVRLDYEGKSTLHNAYLTAHDNAHAVEILGSGTNAGTTLFNCVIEGHGAAMPEHGPLIRVRSGIASINECRVNYGMSQPASDEHGIIQVDSGDVAIYRLVYNRGNTGPQVPLVYAGGGVVRVAATASCTSEMPVYVEAGGLVKSDDSMAKAA